MALTPRPYQLEAVEALHNHICTKKTNPCVVLPTGSGKSLVMAQANARWKQSHPWYRCIILAHRMELVKQNADEMERYYPGLNVGIYSAALKRRDTEADILFASIDSVYKRSGDFRPWDAIFIDEAHRIPFKGEGKYRSFIRGSQRFNENLIVVGFTATPFRMAGGKLCHPTHLLNEVCYEANVRDLIAQGYLCNLRTKIGDAHADVSGVHKRGGDYITKELAERTNDAKLVSDTVSEILRIIDADNRQSVLVFCVDVKHAKMVSAEFEKQGQPAPYIIGKTSVKDRTKIVNWFKARKVRVLVNVNVHTEGFNAANVDCVVLLRPTLSAGLYSQMVGRGLRCCDGKRDCLVLDFANCISEHGPIDLLGGRPVVLAHCPNCKEAFSRAIGACPACGWEIPKNHIKVMEAAEEAKRRMHDRKAAALAILSGEPVVYPVDRVVVYRHEKPGKPDSLRVQYICGAKVFREWICLDHDNSERAQFWWRERFGGSPKKHVTVDEALELLFLESHLLSWTKTITVVHQGRGQWIVDYNQPLGGKNEPTTDSSSVLRINRMEGVSA